MAAKNLNGTALAPVGSTQSVEAKKREGAMHFIWCTECTEHSVAEKGPDKDWGAGDDVGRKRRFFAVPTNVDW